MTIGIVGNIDKLKALQAIKKFVSILSQYNMDYVYARELVNYIPVQKNDRVEALATLANVSDIIVAFGGDGTILSTANIIGKSGVPILGVNVGTLGFLTEVVTEELEDTVKLLVDGNYSIINRMALRVEILQNHCQGIYHALNDVVLDKGAGSRLIYIDVYVDGRFLNSYRSDGLIVSTPTGSTAYSMSAGGPLVVPTMHAAVVTPICPHSVTMKPIVLSGDSAIELSIREEATGVQLSVDGRTKCQVRYFEKVQVKKAEYDVKWISIGRHDFFDILRTKLNWGAGQPDPVT